MATSKSDRITSCTIFWKDPEDLLSVVTKVLQTEIQVRFYNSGRLTGGRIWPMTEPEKEALYHILYRCLEDWDQDDTTPDAADGKQWQLKICSSRSCLTSICGTTQPQPHGAEIKKLLVGIMGEDHCYFF